MHAFHTSSDEGRHVELVSRPDRPALLSANAYADEIA